MMQKRSSFSASSPTSVVARVANVSHSDRDVLSKKLLWPRSKRFLPAFSLRILMASCLPLRSFIHFEFIFVYGVRKWSRFILLHVAVQFSQHHLLKRLSLFHWIFFPALSKMTPSEAWRTGQDWRTTFSWSLGSGTVWKLVLLARETS
uniref:Uncharacterized protein n=1 Tax=Felis catus TaxID=9685 RepID=A0ABI7XUJ2_FELCA